MKRPEPVILCRPSGPHFLKTCLVAACCSVVAAKAVAQQVLVPFPAIPAEQLQPPPENVATNQTESTYSAAPTTAPATPPSLRTGPVVYHPHLAYQFLYGTGILSSPGVSQKTAVNSISPGIGLDLGRHWTLDYTPTIQLYSEASFQNTVNQFINLAGNTTYNDWRFGLSQNCAITSDPQVQTGQQTDQQNYLTVFTADYQLSSQITLEMAANQNLFFVTQNLTNSVGNSLDWSTTDWLNYHWGPNVGTAGGVGFGYDHVQSGVDMSYEQAQARVTWQVARKINLSVNGGAEFRQFIDSPQSMLISPISAAAITYQPFEHTTLILNGNRTVSASYFENLVAQTYNVNLSLSQRLLGRLYLGLTGGYNQSKYKPSGVPIPGNTSNGRTDNYTFFSVSLNTLILKRGTASVFYSTSHNSSNTSGFTYSSDQVGFQLAWRY